ncbi:hypothetical protein ES705_13530 [subsurface metagenome]
MSGSTTGYDDIDKNIINSTGFTGIESINHLTAGNEYILIPQVFELEQEQEEIEISKEARKKEYWPFLEESPKI